MNENWAKAVECIRLLVN